MRLVGAGGALLAGSGLEGAATSAGANRIRILNAEPATHQAVDIVNLCAVEILDAAGVDHNLDTVDLKNLIAQFRTLGKGHAIREAGTAPPGHKNTQSMTIDPLFFHNTLKFIRC